MTLSAEEHRRARARATARGVSLAEYIRTLVAADAADTTPAGDVTEIFGIGDSGGSDVAAAKDEYVGRAVADR